MPKVLSHENKNCQNCGGSLMFSPKKQALECQNCGAVVPISVKSEILAHDFYLVSDVNKQKTEWGNENKLLKCSNCGANIILNGLEYSKTCPYCKSPNVALTDELPGLKPDAVLPFKFDESEAKLKFKEKIRHKWFVPNVVKKGLPINKFTGTYIASFVFNCKTHSYYVGTLSYTETTTDDEGHTKTETCYVNVNNTIDMNFKDLVTEASSLISQEDYDSVKPFDFSQNVAFDMDYLRGFVVEHYNEGLAECNEEAESIMTQSIKSAILRKHNCDNIVRLKLNTDYFEKKFKYTLLPFYFFEYTYKNKKYRTAMNGQTGKIGKVPRSAAKIIAFIIAILGIVLALALIFMFTANFFVTVE